MTTEEKIEFYTCHLEDRARNMWKVIEVSDLEDIMKTYHQEQVKKLNIDDVSKCSLLDHIPNNLDFDDEMNGWCSKCNKVIQ